MEIISNYIENNDCNYNIENKMHILLTLISKLEIELEYIDNVTLMILCEVEKIN